MSEFTDKRCGLHPEYDPIKNPTGGCEICYEIFQEALAKAAELQRNHKHPERKKFPQDPAVERWKDEGGSTLG